VTWKVLLNIIKYSFARKKQMKKIMLRGGDVKCQEIMERAAVSTHVKGTELSMENDFLYPIILH